MVQEVIRLQERAVDNQVRALEELDGKTEQMVKVSISALAGGIALGAFLSDRLGATGWGLLLVVGIASVTNLVSTGFFLRAYGAFLDETSVEVGPAPPWLARTPMGEGWDRATLTGATVHGYSAYYRRKDRMVDFIEHQRRRGIRWLAAAVTAYALAGWGFLFVLATPMVGMVT